jgi:hypothetical protein
MPDPTPPVALRAQRERTIQTLCDEFAADHLEVAEFEQRLDSANRALTMADLESLTADLPARAAAAEAARLAPAVPAAGAPPATWRQRAGQVFVGIMGGVTRRGRWQPAHESTAIAVMGGIMLDFREAQLPPGETVVHAFALMGGVSIMVPPELNVEVNGIGIMGGFDHLNVTPGTAAPDAPRLHIDGVAIMGGVDVQVKGPNDPTPWDSHHAAHAQRHEERRRLREEARRLRDEWRRSR